MNKTKLVKTKGTKAKPQTYEDWLKRNEITARTLKDSQKKMSMERKDKGK